MKFIVDFINTASEEQIQEYLAAANATVIKTYSAFDKTFLVEAASEPVKTALIEFVINDEASPIQLQSTFRPVEFDTASNDNWWKMATFGNPDFNAPTQHYERFGTHATVYVVDSGINTSHPEFAVNVPQNLFSFNGDFTDYNGHGTALASLISGETCGVTDAKVKSVKIFQSGTSTLQSDMLAAFNAIIADMQPEKANIINLSWSIPKNEFIESKIRQVVQAGAFVVAAAGNSSEAIDNVTPASMPEVVTVGAYGQDLLPCNFSNYTGPVSTTTGVVNGGELDCWGPGSDIRVAVVGNSFSNIGGTSVAAAIMSATIAFNSSTLVTGSGLLPDELGNSLILENSIGKDNLLTLQNQYSVSVNKIAKFLGEYSGQNGASWKYTSKHDIFVHNDLKVSKILFNMLDVKQYSINKPLPNGLAFDGMWLIGQTTIQISEIFNAELTVESYSGQIKTIPLNLYLIPSGLTENQFIEDKNLDITLLAPCGPEAFGGGFQCGGTCPPTSTCFDACGSGFEKAAGTLQCYCNPPFQGCQ